MFAVRLALALLLAWLAVTGLMYLVTRNSRWLRFAWRGIQIGILICLFGLGFLVLERFLLVL